MKKVVAVLCMFLIVTLIGGTNVKPVSAETKVTTITFNANGGTGKMENGVIDDTYVLPKNGFKKSGYKFVGWSTLKKATDDSNFYEVGASVYFSDSEENVTLYAQWVKAKTYKITYIKVKGAKVSSDAIKKYTSGKKTMLPSVNLTEEGEFAGWTITVNGKDFGPIMEIPPYVSGNIKLKPMIVEFEG